ncbi:hypothetical protein TUM4630_21330 [Shewanella algidipiscicola]|uniref:Uncharacterized protein n=1 Tax=Shewanella algidipiscicola TaxID=614070 RepID=A0ABQ4PIK8_9GAMM|nr:hypothetical protein TUM4630_21330 [Shewanella algidipiscicola]
MGAFFVSLIERLAVAQSQNQHVNASLIHLSYKKTFALGADSGNLTTNAMQHGTASRQ